MVSAEIPKAANYQKKQETARLTEKLKLIKSFVVDLQVEAKAMSSEKNITVSKVQKMQGGINDIVADLITRIKK